jgi:hypothetical protein
MTLILAPDLHSKAGARRWSGSATCGPLKVSRLTTTPVDGAHAAADGAELTGGWLAGAVVGAGEAAPVEALGVAGAHAEATMTNAARSPAPRSNGRLPM